MLSITFNKLFTLLFVVIFFCACTRKVTPYDSGPKMSQKQIKETFQPILDFMNYQPGMSFADVGAGSGSTTVIMTSLMDNSTVYIQDIDSTTLQKKNLNRLIDYYSKQSGQNLRTKNKIETITGGTYHSNLPNYTFDLIYSNGAVHNFNSLDSMVIDLRKKLKPNGRLFLRDSFKSSKENYCVQCKKPLLSMDEFLLIMKRSGFKLIKESPNMKGHPIYGFSIARLY